jgi:diguanylate cyclase (GGDEF)-like protein
MPLLSADFVWLLFSAVALMNILIVVFAAVTLRQARVQYEEQAATTTQNLAKVLEKELVGIISNSDLAMVAIVDEYTRQRASGSVDNQTMAAFVARAHSRHPVLESLRMTDAQGTVRYGDDDPGSPGSRVSISDRDYFIHLRDNPHEEFFISTPVISRISGKPVITFSRRINEQNGAFGGIVYAAMSVDALTKTLSEIVVGTHGSIALRGPDLGIIARYPERPGSGETIGNSLVSGELLQRVLAGKEAGTFHAVLPLDNVERVASYRRVAQFPLHVIVGIATDDYLAVWRRSAVRAWAMIGVFFLMSVALSMLVYRYWKKQKVTATELERQAQTDALTGLANRRHFLELAENELLRARRYGSPLSMLMLDIDFFKRVNDTYGHKTGDIVLRHVAEICGKTMRGVDVVGRIGGEEFAALLPETDREHAREAAERLRLAVAESETPSDPGILVKITASIGVTTLADGNSSVDRLLTQADQAMYEAKRSGRNNVSVAKNLAG